MKVILNDNYIIRKNFIHELMVKSLKIGQLSSRINRIKLEGYFNII